MLTPHSAITRLNEIAALYPGKPIAGDIRQCAKVLADEIERQREALSGATVITNTASAEIKRLRGLLAEAMDSRAPDYADAAHSGWSARARAALNIHPSKPL